MASLKRFFKDLSSKLNEDRVSTGAAALSYYLMLAIFPAMIFLLTLVPYLHIPNLQQTVMGQLTQLLPGDASKMFTSTVQDVVSKQRGGLLSVGVLATLWAASSGTYAVMQQLSVCYRVEDRRSFIKARGTSLLLTIALGVLIVVAFACIIAGGHVESFLSEHLGWGRAILLAFSVARWAVVAFALLLAISITYRFGPDVKEKFKLFRKGNVVAAVLLIAASLGVKLYVDNFGKYGATYGSIGAVIAFMLWLNIMGYVILLGAEVNTVTEAKRKGQGKETAAGPERPAAAA